MLQHRGLEQGKTRQGLASVGGMEVLSGHLEGKGLLSLDLGDLVETRGTRTATAAVGEGVGGSGVGVPMVVVMVVVGGYGGGAEREVVLLLLVGGLLVLGGGG